MTKKTKTPAKRQPKAKPQITIAAATKRLAKIARRQAKPATSSPRVYTSANPPRWTHVNAAKALRILRHIHNGLTLEAHTRLGQNAMLYIDSWHVNLIARDAAEKAAIQNRIQTHNHDVAGIASAIDLTARDKTGTGILSFDWAEMLKRIEAAAAKHAVKRTRGRAAGANRHLQYACPVCSERVDRGGKTQITNTVRASASDRIIMCAGRHGAQHEPALMEFVLESQPDYRLADASAAAGYSEPNQLADSATGGHDRSAARIAAEKARYALKLAQPDPISDLTDIRDLEHDEFGGL